MVRKAKPKTVAKKSSRPRWTDEDELIGRQIMEEVRSDKNTYQGTFLEKYTLATHILFGMRYVDLSPGVKSFISMVGGKNSHKNCSKKNNTHLTYVETLKDSFWKHAVANPTDVISGLHPDEFELANQITARSLE